MHSVRRPTSVVCKTSAASIVALLLAFTSPAVAQTFSMPGRVLRDAPTSSSQTPPSQVLPPKPHSNTHDNAWARQFYLQVRRCWRHPPNDGSAPVEAVFVIKLTRTGHLNGPPTSLQLPRTEYEKRYHASALAALVTCQPYDLPPGDYDKWRKFEPVFHERAR